MLTRPAPRAPASAAALPPPGGGLLARQHAREVAHGELCDAARHGRALIAGRTERSGFGGGRGVGGQRPPGVRGLQQRRDVRGRPWLPEEESLGALAAELAQALDLARG